jgi:hypothetical protein
LKVKILRIKLTILIKRAPNIEVKNPCTVKPGMKKAVSFSITALIMKMKKPRERRVSGRVKKIRSGLKTAFRKPRIRAAKKAAIILSTIIPLKNAAVTSMARVCIRTLNQK